MVEQPIRNRQVVGSTPTLGSNISHLILFGSLSKLVHWLWKIIADNFEDHSKKGTDFTKHLRVEKRRWLRIGNRQRN